MNPADLLVQSDKLVAQVEQQVAAIAMAAAFFISCTRLVFVLYKKGYENIIPYAKDQTGRFMIICALCTPLPFLGGAGEGKTGTFIGTFPRMVISAGFAQAGDGTVFQNMDSIKNRYDRDIESKDLSEKLNSLKEASPLMGIKIKWVDAIKVRLAQLVFLVPLVPPCACLALFHPELGALMMLISYIISEYMAVVCCGIGVNIAVDNMLFVLGTVNGLVRDFIGTISGFLFYTSLTFTFAGVIISAAIRAAVFSVVFPFSVISMAFDSRQEVFYQNVVRSFAIALTPIVAVNVLQVLVMAYDLFAGGNGIASRIIGAYLFSDVDKLKNAGVFVVAGHMYGFVFRLFMVTVLAPAVLCVPAAVCLARSYSIASEAVGAVSSYSAVLSRKTGE